MGILDNNNDYFLHDFNEQKDKQQDKPQDSQPQAEDAPQQSSQPASANGQQFEFGDQNQQSQPSAAQEPQPQPQPQPEPLKPVKRKRGRFKRFMMWFVGILLVVLGVTVYIRYFVPYAEESKTRGLITSVEKRGLIFKTFEGDMISEVQMADTTRTYARDYSFSIPNDSLGRVVQSYQATGKPVVLTTKRYYGNVPWRGATNVIVTDIQPAQ